MHVYLLKDYARVDGSTGDFIENEYASDFHKETASIMLESGRNQFISFQIIGEAFGGSLSDFTLEFSDLSGPASISKQAYDVSLEWFHQIGERSIPDALIPVSSREDKFTLPLSYPFVENQKVLALWVDLFIPEQASAGDYSGSLLLSLNGQVCKFQVEVVVHSVAVPNRSKLTADLNAYTDWLSPIFPELKENEDRFIDGSFSEIEGRYAKMAREHRCVLQTLGYTQSGAVTPSFAPELEGEGKQIRVKSWELFDKHFGPVLDGTLFEGSKGGEHPIEYMYLPFNLGWPASFAKWGKKGYKTEYRRIIKEFVRHFEEKGWTKTIFEIFLNHKKMYRYYPYTIDEIWYEHDEEVLDKFYEVLGESLQDTEVQIELRIDTSNHYGNHFGSRHSDKFKIWYVNSNIFSWFPESVPLMKQKGNVIWLYGGVLLGLEESLVHLFVWPVRSFMTGVDGFSQWNSTECGDDPFRTPSHNGIEGIMYPGGKFGINGPLASIRLKALRNYMQLGDLLMSTNGTDNETIKPSMRKAKEIVNRHFGFADDSGWWKEKPDFVNEPPQYWDFANKFNAASPVPFHKNRSPVLIEQLTKEVLKLLSRS